MAAEVSAADAHPGNRPPSGPAAGPSGPVPHYGFIDALRGLAFLGVLGHHVVPRVDGLPKIVGSVARAGGEGVQLFFIVSSLTLFLSFDGRRATQRRPLAAFFLRRFFRIAPLFYLAAVFYPWLAARGPDGVRPPAAAVLATLGFVHVWHPGWVNRVVPGGWSIGVEMEFYLLVPWLYARVRRAESAATAAFLTLLVGGAASAAVAAGLPRVLGTGPQAAGLFAWYWLPAQLPIFFLGITLYFLTRGHLPVHPGGRRDRFRAWVLLAAAAYLFAAGAASDLHLFLGHALFGVAFVLAGWGLSLHPTPAVVNHVTRGLGKISYSAYITHFAALELAEVGLTRAGATGLPPAAALGLLLAATLALTVVASLVTYHMVELPGQRVGRWLISRNEQRVRPAGPAAGAGTPGDEAGPIPGCR